MYVIEARNPHQALPEVMYLLKSCGTRRASRNGPVQKVNMPVTIVYHKPQERVVFWPKRDANPFFHLLEALWMLAGRDDVAFLAEILPRMREFSDDGVWFHGAYGYRWRTHFGQDQLESIAGGLRANPDCRRQVLQIWDAKSDLNQKSKDLPCNTQVFFSVNDGYLDMMVCNRSNDAVWGALGANAVHFSILLEYMAAKTGFPVGRYWQVTNNLHLYTEPHGALMEELAAKAFPSTQKTCPYQDGKVVATPMFTPNDVDQFEHDLPFFLQEGAHLGIKHRFLRRVAGPMLAAIRGYKHYGPPERYSNAWQAIFTIDPDKNDWRAAATEWVGRRNDRWETKHGTKSGSEGA